MPIYEVVSAKRILAYTYTWNKTKQMVLLILTEISYFIIASEEEKTETEHANKNGWNVDRDWNARLSR